MKFTDFFNYDGKAEAPVKNSLVFLANLPVEDWEHILAFAQRHRYAAGECVVRQGETSMALYIVASGELDVVFIGDDNRERLVSSIDALSVFGEQAFLDGLPRSASVRARTDAEVHLLSRDAFDSLAVRHPELARQLLLELGRIVSLRLREMTIIAMQGGR
ncbi:cyclic nucleotide-binding domain-containing protein [Janthinobacterium sp. 17J80-10]|uniref:cyclic nucleotide-binding domain-containing protein n=1 Tax=Janthinobacterium sp. 17J80-10 TaxID=2497863 RepID=UPI0013E8ACC0|nr:cyclic nucleotide-binding domain-containing protein [Janthinobacterium sp. 17J80-10]